MLYWLLRIKERIEFVLMKPFIWYGVYLAKKQPLACNFDIFCVFSGYGLGGSEKVHADIVHCLRHKRLAIFFTRRSKDDFFLKAFSEGGQQIFDISADTDNKRTYWKNFIWRGRLAHYVNRQPSNPVVFNGQSNFAYKLLPHLRASIRNVELIHVAEKQFAAVTFPYVPFIQHRVTPFKTVENAFLKQYDRFGMPPLFKNRWHLIFNQTPVPSHRPVKNFTNHLNVYYVGRGGNQKRLWLFFSIVRKVIAQNWPIGFVMAGPFEQEIPADLREEIDYRGILTQADDLIALHATNHILLMTSAFEGFPLAIMEAMAQGSIPLVTAVDDIPVHIHHGQNGYLLSQPTNESKTVADAVNQLGQILENRSGLEEISAAAHRYAHQNFSSQQFCQHWNQLFFAS